MSRVSASSAICSRSAARRRHGCDDRVRARAAASRCARSRPRGHRHRRVGAQLGGMRGGGHAGAPRQRRRARAVDRSANVRAACWSRARRMRSTPSWPSSATKDSPTPRSSAASRRDRRASTCADAPAMAGRRHVPRRHGSATTSAVAAGAAFGLYPASDFRLTDGRCKDCPTIPQALWYFQHEMIAVREAGTTGRLFRDGRVVRRTTCARGSPDAIPPPRLEYPPLSGWQRPTSSPARGCPRMRRRSNLRPARCARRSCRRLRSTARISMRRRRNSSSRSDDQGARHESTAARS